jgi:mRNA deadenylase 3'-5' endonuclease subunit Ccr4
MQSLPLGIQSKMLVHRQFSAPEEGPCELRIAQFNILADGLSCKRPDKGGFSDIQPDCLEWDFRREHIFQELMRCSPHVIGLQEADKHHDICTFLEQHDYESTFIPKLNSPCLEFSTEPDGCLLLFDTKRFKKVNHDNECFSVGANQVAACVIVEDLMCPGEVYILCTAHLKAGRNDEAEILRTKQIQNIKEKLNDLKKKYSVTGTFVTMDMNGNPQGTAYAEATQFLRSSMLVINGTEPEFTTMKKRGEKQVKHTIDYIFYDTERVEPTRFLEIPSDIGNMPNWNYPSDHLMLCVGFSRALRESSSRTL